MFFGLTFFDTMSVEDSMQMSFSLPSFDTLWTSFSSLSSLDYSIIVVEKKGERRREREQSLGVKRSLGYAKQINRVTET
jgi:hypothetical protein